MQMGVILQAAAVLSCMLLHLCCGSLVGLMRYMTVLYYM